MDRLAAIRNSALWAAYGDAIGFISEFANESGLKQRAGVNSLSQTIAWKKRVGGKFGINVELPAGCYSDDTQLRLAVCRSIDAGGSFDVEAFAKVELPLWLSYTLGAGKGSRRAASNLTKKDVTWATNFFVKSDMDYVNAGGNGAAMRIQPHVWSLAKGRKSESLLRDIIRDAVTTHGHPRGILGAVFHGLCLLYTLDNEVVPSPNEWDTLLKQMEHVGSIVADDDQLSYRWLPRWEKQAGKRFDDACLIVIKEIKTDIKEMEPYLLKGDTGQYRDMVSALDALNPACRGSGAKTALLASGLAFLCRGNVEDAVLTSANTLGSDTDTIGTMVGALVGATVPDGPKGALADQEYIVEEAERAFQISQGKENRTFVYPDLLKWHPPTTQLDALNMSPFGLIFSAFGKVVPDGREYHQEGKYPKTWRWYRLSFKQRVLIKHRKPVKQDRTLPNEEVWFFC
jgi:ADP-ribosylglycohydrolase